MGRISADICRTIRLIVQIDENGNLVDGNGNRIDWDGNRIDENGYLLNMRWKLSRWMKTENISNPTILREPAMPIQALQVRYCQEAVSDTKRSRPAEKIPQIPSRITTWKAKALTNEEAGLD